MSDVSFNIESQDSINLENTFNDLSNIDQKTVLVAAFRKALMPTVEEARRNIPNDKTGNLRKSIGLIIYRNDVSAVVGARTKYGYKGFHAHLVESGTVSRFYTPKKSKAHPIMQGMNVIAFRKLKKDVKYDLGKMNPNAPYAGYLRKAVRDTEDTAASVIGDEWYSAIDRFHKKNNLK